MRTTITTGTTAFILGAGFVGQIQFNPATITASARTQWVRPLAMMEAGTKSEWHLAQNGSAAATWIKALALLPRTWNVSSFFWRHIPWAGIRRKVTPASGIW